MNTNSRFMGISTEYPFGTDAYGRDVFTRVNHGSRYSLVIVSVFGASLINLILVVSIARISPNIRLFRAAVIPLIEHQYIKAARVGGASNLLIIMKHILPIISSTIIIQATMSVSYLILRASGLSFLGLGVPAPAPEWGTLLNEAKGYMTSAPHMMIFPGSALVLLALSINLVGDGLRDAFDSRMKS